MTLNQSLILLLLLGLKVTSGAASSLCVLVMTRCICNVMVIHNPQSLRNCFALEELELRDGYLYRDPHGVDISLDLSVLLFSPLDKLIFNNVTIPFSFMSAVIPFLSYTNLNKIDILSSTLEAARLSNYPELPNRSRIKSLRLEDVTVDPSLLQPSFQQLHRWLFGSLESLAVVRSGLIEIDCNWARRVQHLTWLDLSDNPISFSSLQNISRCSSLSFEDLKSLRLRRSGLTYLPSLCTLLTSLTPALTSLDVSWNNFSIVHYPRCPQPIRMLNLSHSGITQINSMLFTSLEELDLSYNSLKVFNNPPQTLKKLSLSNNPLIQLPSLGKLSQLQDLQMDSNQLSILINDSLSTLEKLESLHAWRNPYQCDCVLNKTIIINRNSTDSMSDLPEESLCASPGDQQGTSGTSGTQRHGSHLCLMLFMGLLSHLIYFY